MSEPAELADIVEMVEAYGDACRHRALSRAADPSQRLTAADAMTLDHRIELIQADLAATIDDARDGELASLLRQIVTAGMAMSIATAGDPAFIEADQAMSDGSRGLDELVATRTASPP